MEKETVLWKEIPADVENILYRLNEHNYIAVVAGGAVRDLIRGETPHDWDIATNALPSDVIALFTDKEYTSYATDKEASFGRCSVVVNKAMYEVTTFRTEKDYTGKRQPGTVDLRASMAEDAMRRDFTMNGLFLDLYGKLYDFVDGEKDARNGDVVFIGNWEDRVNEDPLRILRYMRFILKFGVTTVQPMGVFDLLSKKGYMISSLAVERVVDEMDKIFLLGNTCHIGNAFFNSGGLLKILFGLYIESMVQDCSHNNIQHPERTLANHIGEVFNNLTMQGEKDPDLYWAALMHDLGKPFTKGFLPSGRTTFYGHEQKSVEIAEIFLNAYKFSNKRKEKILWIIGNHMRVTNVKQMKKVKVKKLIAMPYIQELMRFTNADDMINAISPEYAFLSNFIEKYGNWIKPIVTGRDLIHRGYKPGNHFGGMLKGMYNMQLAFDLKDRDQIMDMFFTKGESR